MQDDLIGFIFNFNNVFPASNFMTLEIFNDFV